uniref:Ribonuclease 2 n=1 Tax=Aegilops tauschii TaxID=37682 RepID=M8C5A8_AEGTA
MATATATTACLLAVWSLVGAHGLWPDYDDGTWPSCCRHTSFDMDKLTPLKPALDKYWPSLYCSSSSTCFSGRGPFWAHERSMEHARPLLFMKNYSTSPPPLISTSNITSRNYQFLLLALST